MNRVNSSRYADDICKVVYQFKQFSWTLDKEKTINPLYSKYENHAIELYNIRLIERIVDHALRHGFEDLTDGAMYYHTHDVKPYWKKSKEFVLASAWHKYYKERPV